MLLYELTVLFLHLSKIFRAQERRRLVAVPACRSFRLLAMANLSPRIESLINIIVSAALNVQYIFGFSFER